MSSTTAPPPPPPGGAVPQHPLVRFTESLSGALDRLEHSQAWSMAPAEQAQVLAELSRAEARVHELRLRVFVAADRNQVGSDSGATSTAAWLAHESRATRQRCYAELRLAEKLDGPFEVTRKALAAGLISVEHTKVVVHAVEALTDEHDDLPAGTRERAEAHLLDLARHHDPVELRELGKHLFEVVCPEAADAEEGRKLAKEEARARRLAYLSLRDNGDGTTDGRFRLPTLHAQLLKKALEALTSPRRLGDGRLDPETGTTLSSSTLLGRGFMELLEHHLDVGSLPSSQGCPFTVVVTIGVDALMSGLGVATMETGHRISAGEARRLAAKAGIIPLVLGGASMPLDVGREQRLFTRYQRIAINHRYDNKGCAARNCDRPPSWVEHHHERAWSRGGKTDTKNGMPLCPAHHRMADNPDRWDMHKLPDGTVRFSRRQ